MKNLLSSLILSVMLIASLFVLGPNTAKTYADSPQLSFDDTAGGYYNPVQIKLDGNYLYVVDEGSGSGTQAQVQIIPASNPTAAHNVGSFENGNLQYPSLLETANGKIYIYDSFSHTGGGTGNYFIKEFYYEAAANDYELINPLINEFEDLNGDTQTLGQISSMSKDNSGNIYLAMAGDVLLTLVNGADGGSDYLKQEAISPTLPDGTSLPAGLIGQDTHMFFCCGSNNLMLASSGSVIILTPAQEPDTWQVVNFIDITGTLSGIDIKDIQTDYKDNLYFLGADNNIYKLSSAEDYANLDALGSAGENICAFTFDKTTGSAYFLAKSGITAAFDDPETSIFENLANFKNDPDYQSYLQEHDDYLNSSLSNSPTAVGTITKATLGYTYPYAVGQGAELNAGDFVFILPEAADNPCFYYCLVTNKADYNMTVYINKNNVEIAPNTAYPTDYDTLLVKTLTAKVYKYPTSLAGAEGGSDISLAAMLNMGTKVTAVRLFGGLSDENKNEFYEVIFSSGSTDTYGYINTLCLLGYTGNIDDNPTSPPPPGNSADLYIPLGIGFVVVCVILGFVLIKVSRKKNK